jgi:hypothetical protein
VSDKIGRDAFLYLEPKPDTQPSDFAQCGPCRMFVPNEFLGEGFKRGRCIIHGSFEEIDEDDSCGFMVPWPTPEGEPNDGVVKDHAAELKKMITGSVTSVDSGLVSRRVQCHRCRFPTDDKITKCGLYETLNKKFAEVFALDPNIKRHACCNAQMPKD